MGKQERSAVWLWAAVLLLTTGLLLLRMAYSGFDQVLFGDNDDAMRMVVVRDFLAGQGWFDHAQYRMNTPWGGEMHWSRLVDLPIAALVLLARPFAGASAEIVAGFVWPTILLGLLIWLSGRLTLRLVGREGLLPGMLILACSVITFGEFDFGRVDHHSVQIILTQLVVLFSIDALTRPRAALWAGLAMATALAIGTEALPVVVAGMAVFGMIYVLAPSLHAAVRWFGLAFGLGTVAHLVAALPPQLWFSPACDAISIVYATAALGAGAGLVGLTLLPLRGESWLPRLLAATVVGGALLALLAALFPGCLAGPYAIVDPWLVEYWLKDIGEAKPVFQVIAEQPIYVLSTTVPALLSLAAALHAVMRTEGTHRAAWLIVLAVLAILVAVAFVQLRSIRITLALTGPACAFWVVLARHRYLQRVSLASVLALVGSWVGFAGFIWAMVAYPVAMAQAAAAVETGPETELSHKDCLAPGAYAELAAMPRARIMTPLDLGAFILLYTDHEVVGTPYHRNNQQILDTYHFLNHPIGEAKDILDTRGVTLVVTCAPLASMRGLPDAAEDSFVRLNKRGELPAWLEPISAPDSGLTIYSVRR